MAKINEKEIQEFCSNLKYLRQSAGWTQDELAKKIGASRQTITSIENSKMVPSITLYIALIGIFVMAAAFNPIVNSVVGAIGLDKTINKLFGRK